jgi:hypothetical protein
MMATLQRLEPDSDAAPWIEQLRAACREFLASVESQDNPTASTCGVFADFLGGAVSLARASIATAAVPRSLVATVSGELSLVSSKREVDLAVGGAGVCAGVENLTTRR